MNRHIFLLLIPVLWQSCCPGHSVTLKNDSAEDKVITVRGHHYSSLDHKSWFKGVQFSEIDSAANAYTFTLPKGKEVRVQGGVGGPDLDQQVIVNHNDTILLASDARAKIKKIPIYYFYKVTVDVGR